MSVDVLKQELAALDIKDQRHLTAFLVSLQDERDSAYRKKLARKILQTQNLAVGCWSKWFAFSSLDCKILHSGDLYLSAILLSKIQCV